MSARVAILTLGCKVNAYDTATIGDRLRREGCTIVEPGTAADALRPGTVVDETGAVVATHDGVHRFTIGQRRGTGAAGGPRRYVRAIDAATGTVTLAPAGDLAAGGLRARDVRWGTGTPPASGTAVGVRVRHRHPLVAARLVAAGQGEASVAFEDRGPAVTPGQAAVFYRDDVVLGGGWIVGELAA